MPYTVIIKKSAQKELDSIPKKLQLRIIGVIDLLAVNPFPPNAKKLQGREGYRIRTSDYRILYNVDGDQLEVMVVRIGHRSNIYKQ
jgi:mRNA interferase RelE/StbE